MGENANANTSAMGAIRPSMMQTAAIASAAPIAGSRSVGTFYARATRKPLMGNAVSRPTPSNARGAVVAASCSSTTEKST